MLPRLRVAQGGSGSCLPHSLGNPPSFIKEIGYVLTGAEFELFRHSRSINNPAKLVSAFKFTPAEVLKLAETKI
jgi:hypothetical protein